MKEHLVFYDGACGLCDHAVQFVLKRDKEKSFVFAPLQGETAKKLLKEVPKEDSLVLIENFQTDQRRVYQFGEGALRILWQLPFPWKAVGALHVLPASIPNFFYRIVARNRHRYFPKDRCQLPIGDEKERFLP